MHRSISVALATYNGGKFLQPLLDSLARQTRLPDELVVNDDNSSDDTIGILENFRDRAPFPVRILRNDSNVGVLENFYRCFRATSSDLIFYCDQDDIWRQDKLALMVDQFANPAVRFASHRSLVFGDSIQAGQVIPSNPAYGVIPFPVDSLQVHSLGHQMAFDRSVLTVMEALRPHLPDIAPELSNNFDSYIPFCASLTGSVVLIDDAMVEFRRHSNAVSPAGKVVHQESRLDRIRASAFNDMRAYDRREKLIARAMESGAISREAGERILSAVHVRLTATEAIAGIAEGPLLLRPFRFAAAIFRILRADFSNKRLSRQVFMALALATELPRGRADHPA